MAHFFNNCSSGLARLAFFRGSVQCSWRFGARREFGGINRIPRKNWNKDAERIRIFGEQLDLSKYGVSCKEPQEVSKCLYLKKNCTVRMPDGQSLQVGHLQILGYSLLRMSINKALLSIFKRSPQDISGLDFNYSDKMSHLSISKRSISALLRRYIRQRYEKLARIPMAESAVPLRVRKVFDQRSFHALIGYISLTNDREAVDRLLQDKLAKPIMKGIFGH
ncbi:LAQU0S01e02388g1_1 [Lachancea quebecensis]|uniref:LAQU0S01e02388g1_1 n=1 Tax=Lachancea quebecensis TaxID=1654605 RepID=A0A0P1KLQ5_9SACH|nr:LAQU0S01e02388g1_1 [Lachancea quebecensis]